jgi:hypothetical protein
MSFVLSRQGALSALRYLTNKENPESLVLRLFVNDVIPNSLRTLDDYVELDAPEYAPVILDGDDWKIEEAYWPTAIAEEQKFAFKKAAGKIYGYFLTREKSQDLFLAERFQDGPYDVRVAGDTIKVTAKINMYG